MGCITEKEQRKSVRYQQQPPVLDSISPQQKRPFEAAQIILKFNPEQVSIKQQYMKRVFIGKNASQHGQSTQHLVRQTDTSQLQKERKMVQFDSLYNECIRYYQYHQIEKAEKIAIRIESEFEEEIRDSQKQQLFLKIIHKQHRQMIELIEDIKKAGWVEKSNEKGIKVSVRMQKDGSMGCCIESELKVPYQLMITALIEFDLFKQFVPFLQEAHLHKKAQRNTRIGSAVMKFPMVSARQIHFLATGYNRLQEDGTIFMYTIPLLERQDLQKKFNYIPVQTPGSVRLMYKYMALVYQPISQGKGNLKVYGNIDSKMNFLPEFILQWVIIKFGNQYLTKIVDVANKFQGSKWQQKTLADPSTVDYNRIVIQQYHRKRQSLSN